MRPILIIALIWGGLAGGCSNSFVIADEYYVFLTERQVIYFDTGDDSRHLYASLIPATDDDVQLGLIGSLGRDARFKRDSSSLLLDIRVTPKSAREYMNYYPESLLAEIDADTLVLNGHKDRCNRRGCRFAASFDFNPLNDLPPGVSPDSVWLALDLTRAFKYKGQRLVSDVIWGKLPSVAFDQGVPTPEGAKLGLLDQPTASGGVPGL
ncbi:hypothetical protein KQH82_05040 [bacterium]|nr:hypothetical protein [bacterium]